MSEEPRTTAAGWMGTWQFPRIFRAARLALDPSKLILALAALVASFAWGALLDLLWKAMGRGVSGTALASCLAGSAAPSPKGDHGIGELWRDHTLLEIRRGLDLSWVGPGSLADSLREICKATGWVFSHHLGYALLFFLGILAIWSILGGALCRMAAVQYAREEKVGIGQAVRFAREKFVSGFFISPILPMLIMGVVALLLALGGAALAIPGIGNLFALFFPLALLGGLAIAFVLIGSLGGGSLFWPTVAVEGSDGFDAISRSFSYFFGKPVKTIFYALVACVWGSICWAVLHFVIWLTLRAVHACLCFGVGAFGFGWWGMRPKAGEGLTKLDVIWPAPDMGDLYRLWDRAQMGGWEIVPAVYMAFWVLLVVGVLWAFLASFFFCGSTIIYYILRHDVDATDYEDVYLEDETHEEMPKPPAAGPPAGKGVSLPVVSSPAPRPTPLEGAGSGEPPAGGPSGPSGGGE